jgi:hypothetical protein
MRCGTLIHVRLRLPPIAQLDRCALKHAGCVLKTVERSQQRLAHAVELAVDNPAALRAYHPRIRAAVHQPVARFRPGFTQKFSFLEDAVIPAAALQRPVDEDRRALHLYSVIADCRMRALSHFLSWRIPKAQFQVGARHPQGAPRTALRSWCDLQGAQTFACRQEGHDHSENAVEPPREDIRGSAHLPWPQLPRQFYPVMAMAQNARTNQKNVFIEWLEAQFRVAGRSSSRGPVRPLKAPWQARPSLPAICSPQDVPNIDPIVINLIRD